ncbi:hypothetical protein FLK61_34475 [Paenalkalicoccus suaedae]|uniref:Core domain-containing protein n=1 Tax=Paenalkalicoccus suaedae TaxID=2592382 RepID=A0A859FKE8_9BACI|nr:iron-sulfur cluster biosynthesis family protein [Paenalkalicoccus suaedae]QKS73275.1 hypothetical protein FLK61_34475 [Paenalkalicoccus suaedae]
MQLTVKEEAYKWFKDELAVSEGDHVQFYVRYGGDSDFQAGFSLAVTVKEADQIAAETEVNGVKFYIEQKDEWFFDGKDLTVLYKEDINEIAFEHRE